MRRQQNQDGCGDETYGAYSVPKPFRYNKFLIYKKMFLKIIISTFINKYKNLSK